MFLEYNKSPIMNASSLLSLCVFAGVQTPNCIRQTVFDAVELDYPDVTVIVDATAAATPEIHTGNDLHCWLFYLCRFNKFIF